MPRPSAFLGGVFLTALATLVLEIVNTRLLSVLTWYHLAFFAISLAMLGLTSAAVYVYLRPARFDDDGLGGALVGASKAFAVSLVPCHLTLLIFRVPTEIGGDLMRLWTLVATGVVTAVPFFFAGVVLTLALTRTTPRGEMTIGRIYALDLAGAALGCALAVPLLGWVDPTTAVLLLAALAALAAVLFAAAFRGPSRGAWALAAVLALLAGVNGAFYPQVFRVDTMKGRSVPKDLTVDRWNSHSRVTVRPVGMSPVSLWGPGAETPSIDVEQVAIRIDGGAFTVATAFDGDPAKVRWLGYDVTSLPYRLWGQEGPSSVAVIGVGGGRDLLTALAYGSDRVQGIEINGILLDLLAGPLKPLTGLADRPDVSLIHAEGRSWIARTPERFDLIQMALVDTWAATAAGAMTLAENGLYTREAWDAFLDHLSPGGAFSVSRWYSPRQPDETARMLSLASATLLNRGVERPGDALYLAAGDKVATLIVKVEPFSPVELERLDRAAAEAGFRRLATPTRPAREPLLMEILAAGSPQELARAVEHPFLDLSPPTDERPFFFNMLKPGAWLGGVREGQILGGVLDGNLRATGTLILILASVILLVLATIGLPLVAFGGRHGLAPWELLAGAGYFAAIGLGFMLVEIGLIQRFSILLGHPTYSLAVTLLAMILATGVGSELSERWFRRLDRKLLVIPAAITLTLVGLLATLQPILEASLETPLAVRIAVVVGVCAVLGLQLGFCFPLGMRLLRHRSEQGLAWMWGVNGGFGVIGSVAAAVVSLALGISWSIGLGAVCYLALALPMGYFLRSAPASG